jgi:hypothetical protein
VPESRHRFLFERLGDHDFQQLVSAILVQQFPGFVPLPLRQPDVAAMDSVAERQER